jgi:hypothetical protein
LIAGLSKIVELLFWPSLKKKKDIANLNWKLGKSFGEENLDGKTPMALSRDKT